MRAEGKNAPATSATLPGPAAPDEIDAVASAIDGGLPRELVASLTRHNGSGAFAVPPTHQLGDARLVVAEYRAHRQTDESRGGPDHRRWWCSRWVPDAEAVWDMEELNRRHGFG
ncbi:hypothetical protein ACIQRW_06975 [Streptomyces sp. NPDC091287]|uniref:hypothetical protein n=1 Tax=Streptomyces sp. NPDC091287 TaxID=3365988 RepID=UPI00382B7FE6